MKLWGLAKRLFLKPICQYINLCQLVGDIILQLFYLIKVDDCFSFFLCFYKYTILSPQKYTFQKNIEEMTTTEQKIQEKLPNADHNPKRLVVSNLSSLYDEKQINDKLSQLLKSYGQIIEIVCKNRRDKSTYAFVEMSEAESAKKIIQTLNGHQLDRFRPLKIEYYRLNAKEKAIALQKKSQTQKKEEKGKVQDQIPALKNKDTIPEIYKEKKAQPKQSPKKSQFKSGFTKKRFNNNYINHHQGNYSRQNTNNDYKRNSRDHFSKKKQFMHRQDYSKKHRQQENYRSRNKRAYEDSSSSDSSSQEREYRRNRRHEYEEKKNRNQRRFTQRERSYSPYQKKYYKR